ncbi:MAG: DUF2240 family protein [Methanoregula sp.]|uniref:DUF2240 family protein n=1 Tax=Methanoregula sp. TaxID=2052170 RepID=UPI0025FF990E|nr:DUF2240 family protein [Methanoregula sp.]MCK9632336.1 DUF2240 family protein [Methanoregula sp.]
MTLRTTIVAPFRHTRKTGMRKNELVYYFALDRKWMSTEQANQLLRRAEEDGLVRQDNGTYSLTFDSAEVTIPIGFKPTSAIFERNDPTQELIGRIAKVRNVDETEIVAEMNRVIKDGFDTHLLPPAALILLAKKYNIPFEDLRDSFRQAIKKA